MIRNLQTFLRQIPFRNDLTSTYSIVKKKRKHFVFQKTVFFRYMSFPVGFTLVQLLPPIHDVIAELVTVVFLYSLTYENVSYIHLRYLSSGNFGAYLVRAVTLPFSGLLDLLTSSEYVSDQSKLTLYRNILQNNGFLL